MSKLSVKDFKTVKLVPKVPERFKHLAPTTLVSERCTFTIANCSNAVSNAIRRTILCELKVAYLRTEYEEIVTDDPFIIPEMIQKRMRMIPLLQSVPADTKFSLETTNNTLDVQDVKTKLMIRGKPYFDETITILSLQPGKSLKISAKVAYEYGYVPQYGMCALAFNATSICKDVIPADMYVEDGIMSGANKPTGESGTEESSKNVVKPTGAKSHFSDPRVWEIAFNTNGTMPPKQIVTLACNNIIERLKSVLSLLYTMANNDNQYVLTIHGDSDTIGNLLIKTIDELYPDVEAATYSASAIERSVTLRVIYSDDINTLYKNVIEHLIETFKSIMDQI